ncbi:hypothetical protein PVK06_026457 [Gossypium arboreum]|uniref:Uncharacterized protein n=1 Tax=Gossypium arboreum TaxID=29729 RepID=A0ABR0NZ09_GOSAR|nr:hypothetical protein PVK06_026457 [Gossypium arboreum]
MPQEELALMTTCTGFKVGRLSIRRGVSLDCLEGRNHNFFECSFSKVWQLVLRLCSIHKAMGTWRQELAWAILKLREKSLLLAWAILKLREKSLLLVMLKLA